jgi:hypothetical protein
VTGNVVLHAHVEMGTPSIRISDITQPTIGQRLQLGRSNSDVAVECVPCVWISRARAFSRHSLIHRTEIAICFSPWG